MDGYSSWCNFLSDIHVRGNYKNYAGGEYTDEMIGFKNEIIQLFNNVYKSDKSPKNIVSTLNDNINKYYTELLDKSKLLVQNDIKKKIIFSKMITNKLFCFKPHCPQHNYEKEPEHPDKLIQDDFEHDMKHTMDCECLNDKNSNFANQMCSCHICFEFDNKHYYVLFSDFKLCLNIFDNCHTVYGIRCVKKLKHVCIKKCPELETVKLGHLTCIKIAEFLGLHKLNAIKLWNLEKTKCFVISDCPALEHFEVPNLNCCLMMLIHCANKLDKLNMSKLCYIKWLKICNSNKLSSIHLNELCDAEKIKISNCQDLKTIELNKLHGVNKLVLCGLYNLSKIDFPEMMCVKKLVIKDCPNLKEINLPKLSKLNKLIIKNCPALDKLSLDIKCITCSLKINYCKMLSEITLDKLQFVSFICVVKCNNLKHVSFKALKKCKRMVIQESDHMMSSIEKVKSMKTREEKKEALKNVIKDIFDIPLECLKHLYMPPRLDIEKKQKYIVDNLNEICKADNNQDKIKKFKELKYNLEHYKHEAFI